jgi:hypothetical protein
MCSAPTNPTNYNSQLHFPARQQNYRVLLLLLLAVL